MKGDPPPYQPNARDDTAPTPQENVPYQAPARDDTAPTPQDVVIAVMGITGSGKTTFIQQFCRQNLGVGHNLQSCTNKVEVVPCVMPNGRKIFLIDTPGFDDSYRSDTEILGEIADWLAQTYQFKIRLTGLIYLHRIIDVRVGGSGMKNLRMFRKVCGEKGLASVVLATTMWSLCPEADAARREKQLVQNDDLWKHLIGRGARIFRQDRGVESGQKILDYLINLAKPMTLEIQREMVDQNKTLAETAAGIEVQEELEKLKKKHDEEMREIREDMDQAIKEKDKERQEELREYQSQIDNQMRAAEQQAKRLEMSREELRREMKEQHQRELGLLRDEIWQKQQKLESTIRENAQNSKLNAQESRENAKRVERLMKEVEDFKAKARRSEMKEGPYIYEYHRKCPRCGHGIVFNEMRRTLWCTYCRKDFDVTPKE